MRVLCRVIANVLDRVALTSSSIIPKRLVRSLVRVPVVPVVGQSGSAGTKHVTTQNGNRLAVQTLQEFQSGCLRPSGLVYADLIEGTSTRSKLVREIKRVEYGVHL